MSSAARLWKTFRGSRTPFRAAEEVFSFSPERCSPSSRNGVQNRPGIVFSFARIPHLNPICELRGYTDPDQTLREPQIEVCLRYEISMTWRRYNSPTECRKVAVDPANAEAVI